VDMRRIPAATAEKRVSPSREYWLSFAAEYEPDESTGHEQERMA
jgi:hypothetical protein